MQTIFVMVKCELGRAYDVADNAVAVEQEGERLLSTRERDREEMANRIASARYNDMAFRIFRDDALSRFSSSFDLAARYTYMAAKAYDYETGLLPAESSSDPGSRVLGDVVRARTIGRIVDGVPQVGGSVGDPGLADILARMKANWAVVLPSTTTMRLASASAWRAASAGKGHRSTNCTMLATTPLAHCSVLASPLCATSAATRDRL